MADFPVLGGGPGVNLSIPTSGSVDIQIPRVHQTKYFRILCDQTILVDFVEDTGDLPVFADASATEFTDGVPEVLVGGRAEHRVCPASNADASGDFPDMVLRVLNLSAQSAANLRVHVSSRRTIGGLEL